MIAPLMRFLTAAAVGGGLQRLAAKMTAGSGRWERANFRGNTVNLAGGVGVAAGCLVGTASAPHGLAVPSTLVAAVAAGAGANDDLATDPGAAKGLTGHLGALSRGEVTTGLVKLLAISGAALGAGAAIARARGARGAGCAFDAVTSGMLIAGTANLINLFDLRPGRALKVGAVLSAPLTACGSAPASAAFAWTALGSAATAAPADLGERTMLGDVGANTLGTTLGLAYATHPRRRVRLGALVAVTGLIVASEKVSFSAVIEKNTVLAWLDRIGRRP